MTHITTLANNLERRIARPRGAVVASEQASWRAFFAVCTLLFVSSTAVTVLWCNSMADMGGMAMPGGWTMSMAWMRMPGERWTGATVSFVGMWVVMMASMMLPSLAPTLWRYRLSVGRAREIHPSRLTAIVGLGYFFVWTLVGLVVFPVGATMAAFEMQQPALARAVPFAGGLVVLIAGVLQFTMWKAAHLASCRHAPHDDEGPSAHAGAAWRRGVHFGFHCGLSCANLTAIVLVLGVMDLRAMAAVTAAITAERLAPSGKYVARAIGIVLVGAGLIMMMRTAGLP